MTDALPDQSLDDSLHGAIHDATLIARLRRGDEGALLELVQRHRAPLARYCARVLRDTADVDDVLQAVFFRLWTARESLAPTTSLRAYLYAAVRNQALNTLRDTRHQRAHVALTSDVATVPAIDQTHDTDELRRAVHSAIDALPERCREVFLLSREGDLSYPEIAAALGISVNTVKTQMTRALAVLARAAAPFLALVLATRR